MSRQTVILRGPDQRALARKLIEEAPANAVVNILEARRTLDQNAKMWAMLSDLSRAKPEGRVATANTWKLLVMHACGFEMDVLMGLDGQPFTKEFRSSNLRVGEMRDLIEWMYAYGAEQGVEWSDPLKTEAYR